MTDAPREEHTSPRDTDDPLVGVMDVNESGPGSLARRAYRGVAWTTIQSVGTRLITLAATTVLARILTPEDFGLLGMVAVVLALLQTLTDGGLSWATIQKDTLSLGQVHNLFWANVVLGGVMWVVCAASGIPLAWFFERPEIEPLALVLGSGFFLTGLTVQPLALLQREMEFGKRAAIELYSLLAGAVAGILMAVDGQGYWALVGQSLVGSGARVVLVFGIANYRPGMPKTSRGTVALLTFGGFVSATGLVNYVARTLDNVLIGRFFGATELGFYTRAYLLMTLPLLATRTVTSVVLPALSRLQNEPERFGRAYRKSTGAVAFLACPVGVGLLLCSSEAVRLVFGVGWEPVVPLLSWLAIAGVLQPIQATAGWLYIPRGKIKAMFVVGTVFAAVISIALVIGLQWGTVGVAAGYTIASVLIAAPGLYIPHRLTGLSIVETWHTIQPVVIATAIMGVCVLLVTVPLDALQAGWIVSLIVKMSTGVLVYGLITVRWIRPFPIPLPAWLARFVPGRPQR